MTASQVIKRLTHDGQLIEAPFGTTKCAQMFCGRPSPRDWIHALFAPDNPGPMVQLLTKCGRRAHRFVLESEGREVDCTECVDELNAAAARAERLSAWPVMNAILCFMIVYRASASRAARAFPGAVGQTPGVLPADI